LVAQNAELERFRSDLQHARAELDVERQNSTKEVNNFALLIVKHLRHVIQHQAALSSRDAELDGVRFQLQSLQKELDTEREKSTRSEVSSLAVLMTIISDSWHSAPSRSKLAARQA